VVKNDPGQLYTIEGVAAALIMIITAYLVVNATSVYTSGDTHISDMQLETLGSDALTVMGTPVNNAQRSNGTSTLRSILEEPDSGIMDTRFRTEFLELVDTSGTGPERKIHYLANYTCRDEVTDTVSPLLPLSSSARSLTGTEHPVRVTKWVIINKGVCNNVPKSRAVLVEVLVWLD